MPTTPWKDFPAAYQLFKSETVVTLGRLKESYRTEPRGEQSDARVAFHRIKGGALFMGLHEIARAASHLEDYFLGEREHLPEDSFLKLSELVNNLP